MAGALFMSRQDKIEVFRVVDGVKNGKDGASGVANWDELARGFSFGPADEDKFGGRRETNKYA